MSYCTACGHPRKGSTRFCTACGAPTAKEPSSPAPPAETLPAEAPAGSGPHPDTVIDLPAPADASTPPDYYSSGHYSSDYRSPGYRATEDRSPASEEPDDASATSTSLGYGSYGSYGSYGNSSSYGDSDDASATSTSPGSSGSDYSRPDYSRPGYPGSGSGSGDPAPPDLLTSSPSPQRGKIIAAVVVAVVILAGAGGAAYYLTSRHHGSGSGALAGQTTHAGTTSPGPARTPAVAPTASLTPTLTPTPTPPPTPASSGFVTVGPAVGQSADLPAVDDFVNSYFGAINRHSYRKYRALLSPELQQDESSQDFHNGYRSTTDSAATLRAISDLGNGEVGATLTFTSNQLPADSPTNSACDDWHVTLYLSPVAGGYELDPAPAGYHARYHAC
jgi:hypothetical protein